MLRLIKREPTIGRSNLTQSDLDRLIDLDNDYRTDYTYVSSKSYRPNGTVRYENPRMFRLPLSYYRRKWAFEDAWKSGYFYYAYFCVTDFLSRFIANPAKVTGRFVESLFFVLTQVFWTVAYFLFPTMEEDAAKKQKESAEHRPPHRRRYEHEERYSWSSNGATPHVFPMGKLSLPISPHGDRQSSPKSQNRSWFRSVWRTSTYVMRTIIYLITLGLFPTDYRRADRKNEKKVYLTEAAEKAQPRLAFGSFLSKPFSSAETYSEKSSHLLQSSFVKPDHGHRHRHHVSFEEQSAADEEGMQHQTTQAENMEDSEPESTRYLNDAPLRAHPRNYLLRIVDAFTMIFKIIILPLKAALYIGKIIIGPSSSSRVYDLRSRRIEVGQGQADEAPIGRFVNDVPHFFSSTIVNILSFISQVLLAPMYAVSYVAGKFIGSSNSRRVTRAARESSENDYLGIRVFRFVVGLIVAFISGFLSFFGFVASVPLRAIEYIRGKIAVGLANTFGVNAAAIVGYEEEMPVGQQDVATAQQRAVMASSDTAETATRSLVPTYRSRKICGACFMWVLPILFALLLTGFIGKRVVYDKNGLGREQADVLQYPTLLLGKAYEKTSLASRYAYDSTMATGTVWGQKLSTFLRDVSNQLYALVRCLQHYVSNGLEAVRDYFSTLFAVVEKVPEDERQMREKEYMLKYWKAYDDEVESRLEQLRNGQALLDEQITILMRERELDEEKFLELRKAIELSQRPMAPSPPVDQNIQKSAMIAEDLLQKKIEQNIYAYITDKNNMGNEYIDKRLSEMETYLKLKMEELSLRIQMSIEGKLGESKKETAETQNTLSNEIGDLGAAIATLREEIDSMRREKDKKIAEFAHAMMVRDSAHREELLILRKDMMKIIGEEIDKELEGSLANLKAKETSEYGTLKSEILKEVESRVAVLFAGHIAKAANEHRGRIHGDNEDIDVSRGLSEAEILVIKNLIVDALKIYDADKTGKVDYALESSGASVLSTRCTEAYKESSRLESVFGIPLWYSTYSPRSVIQHRSNSLSSGECWAFRGIGYLTIKLSYPIYVTEVSYEHLQAVLHPDGVTKSAPRRFQIWAFRELDDLDTKILLGEYEYDSKGDALQFFVVQHTPEEPTPIIELVVHSNWGADYTCLYRFRVHGQKPHNATIESPRHVGHALHEDLVKEAHSVELK